MSLADAPAGPEMVKSVVLSETTGSEKVTMNSADVAVVVGTPLGYDIWVAKILATGLQSKAPLSVVQSCEQGQQQQALYHELVRTHKMSHTKFQSFAMNNYQVCKCSYKV